MIDKDLLLLPQFHGLLAMIDKDFPHLHASRARIDNGSLQQFSFPATIVHTILGLLNVGDVSKLDPFPRALRLLGCVTSTRLVLEGGSLALGALALGRHFFLHNTSSLFEG